MARLAQADDLALASNVMFGIGGALALFGGIWVIADLADEGRPDEEPSVSWRVGPASLMVEGGF